MMRLNLWRKDIINLDIVFYSLEYFGLQICCFFFYFSSDTKIFARETFAAALPEKLLRIFEEVL